MPSVPFLSTERYQVRATEDYGEGPPSSAIHHQVVTRLLPHFTIERKHYRWPAEVESRAHCGGDRQELDSLGSQAYERGYRRKGLRHIAFRFRFTFESDSGVLFVLFV
jgi:hypothetical protein